MCKFLVNVGSKVRVITDCETKRKKKEKIGKIIAMTENFVVVKYARGYREFWCRRFRSTSRVKNSCMERE